MLLNINEKKTKIVCTIGPATDNYESILALYKAGMNVMRINFSHGVYEEHMKKIALRDRLEEEGIYIAEIDMDMLRRYREAEVMGKKYRHPDRYGILAAREET